MKKFLLIILIGFSFNSFAQVDNAVKQVMKPSIDSLKDAISKIQVSDNISWDTLYVVNSTRGGNLDTLTSPGMYQLTVTGNISLVRIVNVSLSSTGVYSIRTANPLALSGTGTFTTSVVNNRVIISSTATNIIYQRQKL